MKIVDRNPRYIPPKRKVIDDAAMEKKVNSDYMEDVINLCAEGKINPESELKAIAAGDEDYVKKIRDLKIPKTNLSPVKKAKSIIQAIEQDKMSGKKISEILKTAGEASDEELEEHLPGISGKGPAEREEMILDNLKKLENLKVFLKSQRLFEQSMVPGLKGKDILDESGNDERYRKMKDLSELPLVDPSELAFPHVAVRNLQLIQGEPQIPERIAHEQKKQFLYLLEDVSGSMRCDFNHLNRYREQLGRLPSTAYKKGDLPLKIKAESLVMACLKHVKSGDGIVTLRLWNDYLVGPEFKFNQHNWHEVFEQYRKEHYLHGGGNNLPEAINTTAKVILKMIEEQHLDVHPEIIVLTDGEETMSESDLNVPDSIKINIVYLTAFSKDEQDPVRVIRQRGGRVMKVDFD